MLAKPLVMVAGHWCQYRLWFCWHPDLGVMHLSCALDMKVPGRRREATYGLLALANEKLWLGHFGVWAEENTPIFRHSVLLRGASGLSVEALEDIVDIAVTECERFFPAFQFVHRGGKSPSDAPAASMLEFAAEA